MGLNSSPPSIQTILAEQSQVDINSEVCYKIFLVKNEKEILHNIDESMKSVRRRLVHKEYVAWKEFQKLNELAPSDDEDEEVQNYRQSKIATLYMDVAIATKALNEKKQKLLSLRLEVLTAVAKIKREVKEEIERKNKIQNNQ